MILYKRKCIYFNVSHWQNCLGEKKNTPNSEAYFPNKICAYWLKVQSHSR